MTRPPKIDQGSAKRTHELRYYPLGRHLTETLGASAFTPVVEANANYILVQAITENIRYTIDEGQAPTVAIGFQLVAGDLPLAVPVGGTRIVRFIRETAGAILQYQFGKQ